MYTLNSKVGTSCFISRILSAILVCGLFSSSSLAQMVDVPHIINYQGQVKTSDGKTINGSHQITFTIYSDSHAKNMVWQGEYNVEIADGIFSVILGSGKAPLPSSSIMNQPLWVAVRVDEGIEMSLLLS